MTRKNLNHPRSIDNRGAVLVEAALILPFVMLCLLVLLDFGLAVARSNSLSDCARRAARQLILNGAQSANPIGPAAWTGSLAESHPVADELRPHLLCMPAADVELRLTWPQGGCAAGQPVQVELAFDHRPILTTAFGEFALKAKSSMLVVH
jgi:hypothetical protein